MESPMFMQALAELQTDPAAAMKKYEHRTCTDILTRTLHIATCPLIERCPPTHTHLHTHTHTPAHAHAHNTHSHNRSFYSTPHAAAHARYGGNPKVGHFFKSFLEIMGSHLSELGEKEERTSGTSAKVG
jgi:hypothetical protein